MSTASCPLYLRLEARLNILKDKFVRDQMVMELSDPISFSADLDHLAAFRLLAHAEFEEYLESKALEGLDLLENGFFNGAKAVRVNINVLVIGAMLGKPARFDGAQWSEYATGVVKAARTVVSENNGIKAGAFSQLAVFSGKMPDEIDVSLASALTSYGRSRGKVAHMSVTRVRNIRAPSAEAKDADDLLRALQGYFC